MNKIRLLIASDFRLPRIGLRQIVNAVADVEVVADSAGVLQIQVRIPIRP